MNKKIMKKFSEIWEEYRDAFWIDDYMDFDGIFCLSCGYLSGIYWEKKFFRKDNVMEFVKLHKDHYLCFCNLGELNIEEKQQEFNEYKLLKKEKERQILAKNLLEEYEKKEAGTDTDSILKALKKLRSKKCD